MWAPAPSSSSADSAAGLQLRRLLVHGDEHAPAGRASGHRGGHRPRPRRMAVPHRRRRAPCAAPGRRAARPATPSRRASMRRIPIAAFCRRRAASRRSNGRSGEGIRVDAGVAAGDRVPPDYDPMIAKMIAHGATRERGARPPGGGARRHRRGRPARQYAVPRARSSNTRHSAPRSSTPVSSSDMPANCCIAMQPWKPA